MKQCPCYLRIFWLLGLRKLAVVVADLKLHLQSTDYGNFLQNEAGPLNVSVIDDRLREKLVTEFRHLRNQALEPMATFMDFIM